MTEILVVISSAICALFLVDPFYGGALTNSPFAKIIVLVLSFGSFGFHLLGRAIVSPLRLRVAVREVLADWWPLLLLATYIIAGSLVSSTTRGNKESFLGMGLGMLYLPMMALAVRSSESPMRFMKWLGGVYILTMLSMLGFLVATTHLFHESIFLLVPLGAYFLSATRPRPWQLILGLALIGLCAFSLKNTTFIMMLATLGGSLLLISLRLLKERNGLHAVTVLYLGALAVGFCAVALALALPYYQSALPSGNVEYRVYMYDIAWKRFLASPIWGDAWLDASVNYFPLYKVPLGTQNLPTHSDLLDILAQGGVLAFAMWMVVPWRVIRMGTAAVRKLGVSDAAGDVQAWRWLFVLVLIQVNAIITYAVNPPLIGPVPGYWVWGCLGLAWALQRGLTYGPVVQPARVQRFGKTALA